MNLSKNFTLEEATFSEYAVRNKIKNIPSDEVLANMKIAAEGMEKVRSLFGCPIIVSSWLRVEAVNVGIGGSKTSDHVTGFSIDFRIPKFGSPYAVAKRISEFKDFLEYDQLIHEFGSWVHISFSPKKRKQDLTIMKAGKYQAGILEK